MFRTPKDDHGQSVTGDVPAAYSPRMCAHQRLLNRADLIKLPPGFEEPARGGMDRRVGIVPVKGQKVRDQVRPLARGADRG